MSNRGLLASLALLAGTLAAIAHTRLELVSVELQEALALALSQLMAALVALLCLGIEPWRAPLALADRGLYAWHYIQRHPQWLLGMVVCVAVLRPVRISKWLGRSVLAWQMLHRLSVGNRKHLAEIPHNIHRGKDDE
ncbi:MAG: YqjK-like family protein [Halioglobus sp.]